MMSGDKPARRRLVPLVGMMILPMMTACGGHETTAPPTPPVTPAQLEILSGNGQTIAAGDSAHDPLAVRVRGSDGAAFAGAAVSWTVSQGSATLDPITSPSDPTGIARTRVRAIASTGTIEVTASVGSVTPAVFTLYGPNPNTPDPCSPLSTPAIEIGRSIAGSLGPGDCNIAGNLYDFFAFGLDTQRVVTLDERSHDFEPSVLVFEWASGLGRGRVTHADEAVLKAILPGGSFAVGSSSKPAGATGTYTIVIDTGGSEDVHDCASILVVHWVRTAQRLERTDCVEDTGRYHDSFVAAMWGNEALAVGMISHDFTPHLRITDASNTVVAESDFSRRDTAIVEYPVGSPGYYTIEATSGTPGATGTYTLTVAPIADRLFSRSRVVQRTPSPVVLRPVR